MLKRILFFVILSFISIFCVFSQEIIDKKIAIQWEKDPFMDDDGVLYPAFYNAYYQDSYGLIPVFKQTFSVEKKGQRAKISFSNMVYLPITNENLLTDFEYNLIHDSLQWFQEVFHEKNSTGVIVKILPYRRNQESGLLEQLYYAEINISFTDDLQYFATKNSLEQTYPEHSIFASGDWFKIQVASSGVYKITGADLKNAGMNIASINPKRLKVYGNGGGMIPEANSRQKYLSLQENAIVVVGEADGVFNESDYILFYGESPNVWEFNTAKTSFSHRINVYSNYTYYFIGESEGDGKRIQTVDNNSLSETYNTNQSDYYDFHESELTNMSNGGKTWLGENFNSINKEQSFSVNIPNIITSEPASITTGVAAGIANSNASSNFIFSINETTVQTIAVAGPPLIYPHYNAGYKTKSFSFTAPSPSFSLKLRFNGHSNVNGWLDYFELYARRSLIFTGGQMAFSDAKSIADDRITKFSISNASNAVVVWDITDQTNINKMVLNVSGSTASFKSPTSEIKFFMAFDGTSFYTPTILGKVVNQDLTGLRDIQSVIISPPDFFDLAETLAQVHRDDYGLNTIVVTPQQIYNEFSSGKQDVGAIRDFMRMLYKTAQRGLEPEYLLLYGKGTYDYKNLKEKNNNFVPIWTSERAPFIEGTGEAREYSTDDFFGFLDDDEGNFNDNGYINGRMDLGIGRFPVKNREEAEIALNKRLHYTSNHPETKGSWQNIVCFTADDGDGKENFPRYSERLATIFETLTPSVLIDKIYIDSYKQIHAAGGTRYPDAKNALTHRINSGSLIVDYVGHGSIYGWAEERVMEVSDAQSYTNYDHLTFLVTATCSFTRYDDPEKISSGEYNFLNANGSAIGLLTTIRETNSGGNQDMASSFYTHLISDGEGNPAIHSIGYAQKKAKYENSNKTNTQYFVLLGDPTMPLAFPEKQITCTSIERCPQIDSSKNMDFNKNPKMQSDTIQALSKMIVRGIVHDQQGNRLENFNGKVFSKVFDKQAHLKTLQNDPLTPLVEFDLWKNLIFSGSGEISNGFFDVTFFVPKDIDYTYGNGRISLFAVDTIDYTDATGTYNELIVGGINPYADVDTTAPAMNLFINNTQFVSGGITDENPILLVKLSDIHGINTTGNSIGHDLTAIMDDDVSTTINLNNFYNTENNYTSGSVKYQFYDLSEGEHSVSVIAWDSYNNSVKKTICFTVVNAENIKVENLYNYPNPMKSYTNFVFEHNQAGAALNITLQIFDLTGRLVQQIHKNVVSSGYRTEPIIWDGCNNGAALRNGIYLYRARIEFPDGTLQVKNNKLIICR